VIDYELKNIDIEDIEDLLFNIEKILIGLFSNNLGIDKSKLTREAKLFE